jgi:5-hydroxyisourate hydrolase
MSVETPLFQGNSPKISCHVLDTTKGLPASSIDVSLFVIGQLEPIATGVTNHDGRVVLDTAKLTGASHTLQLRFHTADYCQSHYQSAFYPFVDVYFNVEANEKYHIPLLLSPYSYSTYRGS